MSDKQKVFITSDSACDLPPELLEKYNIKLISCHLKTRRGEFLENYEITTENALTYEKRYKEPPALVAPSVEEYTEFFEKRLESAPFVCHISISSHSGLAFLNAVEAALSLKNVHVIDSMNLSCGIGLLAIQAAKLAQDGFGVPFIAAEINQYVRKIRTSFSAKNAEYELLSGTIPPHICSIMDFFSLSPCIEIKGGAIKTMNFHVGKNQTYWQKFIRRELARHKNIDTSVLFISCCNPMKEAVKKYIEEIEKYVRFERIIPVSITSKIAYNMGPDVIGLHFTLK